MQDVLLSKSKGNKALELHVSRLNRQQKALDDLNQSVIELDEIFFYLGALVDKESDQLANIEDYVNKTDE